MSLKKRFSEQDLARIKQAVQQAESKISGEIVPFIVEKSDAYTIASYRAAVLSAAIFFLGIIFIDRYIPDFAIYDPIFIFLIVLAGGIMGALLTAKIDVLQRVFISQEHFDRVTKQKAEAAFLQEEVFSTKQRTGILLFISFFEHEVIVMADKGISKVVEQKEWDSMVKTLIDKIKTGDTVGGLEACISRCGQILLEKEFTITADDTNELKDDLRIQ
jgi:putative membrane protein